ncbi:MAG: hypothetical protein OEL53_05335 [Rhodospirillales bacterium]|nr:hypothetical protein [Rhodospirillales bacterium]
MIVFEKFSLLAFILLYRRIRRAGAFYLLDRCAYTSRPEDLAGVRRLCRWLMPGVSVTLLEHWKHEQACYRANAEQPAFANDVEDSLMSSPAAVALEKLGYARKGIAVALKKYLQDYVRTPLLLRQVVAAHQQSGQQIWIVPQQADIFGVFASGAARVPWQIAALNRLKAFFGFVMALPQFLAAMAVNLRKTRRGLPPPRLWKYANIVSHPTLGNVLDDEKLGYRRRQRWDSFFLEDGKEFTPQSILYCLSLWRFTPKQEKALRDHIEGRGGVLCAAFDLPPSQDHILRRQLGKFLPAMASCFLASLAGGPRQWFAWEAASRALHHINLWEIFCLHHRPLVMMGPDDYSISHVARSLAFERNGLLNTGIHHSAQGGPFISPDISFNYFHCHFRYGLWESRLFSPYWDNDPHIHIGPPKQDLVLESQSDPERRKAFAEKYGGAPKKFVMAAPGAHSSIQVSPEKNRIFYSALGSLLTLRRDVVLLLRPRVKVDEKLYQDYLAKFESEGRVHVEMNDFDTWELIAFCDIVLCPSSSMMCEAWAAGTPALNFPLTGIGRLYPFYAYNPLLVSTAHDELLENLQRLLDDADAVDRADLRRLLGGRDQPGSLTAMRRTLQDLAEGRKIECPDNEHDAAVTNATH